MAFNRNDIKVLRDKLQQIFLKYQELNGPFAKNPKPPRKKGSTTNRATRTEATVDRDIPVNSQIGVDGVNGDVAAPALNSVTNSFTKAFWGELDIRLRSLDGKLVTREFEHPGSKPSSDEGDEFVALKGKIEEMETELKVAIILLELSAG